MAKKEQDKLQMMLNTLQQQHETMSSEHQMNKSELS
jgi:hypothetical protein